jgi:SagB-type dehydrogenase family enzyme
VAIASRIAQEHATIFTDSLIQPLEVIPMRFAYPCLFPSILSVFLSTCFLSISNSAADNTRESIKLPQPLEDSKTSVEKALQKRRSIRQYKNQPMSLPELAQLLWAAQGITGSGGRRTAPSAGALYPLEVYVVAGNVTGLSAGIYSYEPHKNELHRIAEGDARAELSKAALGQASIKNAAADLVLAAVYERTTVKYGERGIRYVHMEAGHAAQNVLLQAVSLDLGAVVIGAFPDEQVRTALHLSEREHPLSIMPVGKI